jgi:hypothetical protein
VRSGVGHAVIATTALLISVCTDRPSSRSPGNPVPVGPERYEDAAVSVGRPVACSSGRAAVLTNRGDKVTEQTYREDSHESTKPCPCPANGPARKKRVYRRSRFLSILTGDRMIAYRHDPRRAGFEPWKQKHIESVNVVCLKDVVDRMRHERAVYCDNLYAGCVGVIQGRRTTASIGTIVGRMELLHMEKHHHPPLSHSVIALLSP